MEKLVTFIFIFDISQLCWEETTVLQILFKSVPNWALMMQLVSHLITISLPATLPTNEEHKQKLNCSGFLNIYLSAQ